MSEVDSLPELRDVVVRVEPIPRTKLVHLDVDGVGGLVLSRTEAARIGRDLLRVTGYRGWRGPAGAGAARRGAPAGANTAP